MRSFLRSLWITLATVVLTATLVAPAQATDRSFPDVIDLPTGWRPEGIAAGLGTTVYVGSLANGAVWKGDIRTGRGTTLVRGATGRVTVGIKYSKGLIYAAGGPTGMASVYDARTGETVLDCPLAAPGAGFINDVVVTRDAAYFTNSRAAELYRMPIGRRGPSCAIETIALRGEWTQDQTPGANNANGIDATVLGLRLIIVNSVVGAVYSVNPRTGYADRIDTDAVLTNGDGILLRGRELSVMRNREEQVVVLKLSWDLSSARQVDTVSDPDFDVPTTLAAFGRTLYTVNAKFGALAPETLPYEIVRVDGR